MLQITIPETELFDNKTQTFIYVKQQTLQLEHSLVSLSKWESKWEKPFLTKTPMTRAQSVDYIRCMTITQNVDPNVYLCITNDIIEKVSSYIEAPMTATWFSDENKKKYGKNEIATAEVIYWWMISLQIPFECRKWHLNKLLTLIRVCSEKNAPPKKTNNKEWANQRRALNAARRKSLHTKG